MANLQILFLFVIVLIVVHAGITEWLIMKQMINQLLIELKNQKRIQGFVAPRPDDYINKLDLDLLEKTSKLQNVRDPVMEATLAEFINELPTQNTTPLAFSDETIFGSPWNTSTKFDSPY